MSLHQAITLFKSLPLNFKFMLQTIEITDLVKMIGMDSHGHPRDNSIQENSQGDSPSIQEPPKLFQFGI